MKQKWNDALSVAAAESSSWEAAAVKSERATTEKLTGGLKKPWGLGSLAGVAAIEEATGRERKRRCWFFQLLGCDKDHPAFTCELLKIQEPEAKKRVLQDSGLCLIFMRHSAKS